MQEYIICIFVGKEDISFIHFIHTIHSQTLFLEQELPSVPFSNRMNVCVLFACWCNNDKSLNKMMRDLPFSLLEHIISQF